MQYVSILRHFPTRLAGLRRVFNTVSKRLFENYLFHPISVLLEEFNPQNTIVFLRLNSSSALNLNKLSNFQTASKIM
jgi:hypothetical protein